MAAITTVTHIDNVRLSEDRRHVVIIDQTELPNRMVYLTLDDEKSCYEAILKLRVRGAPAIGIFAGYAMYVLCLPDAAPYPEFAAEFHRKAEYLNSSRPTAVNLSWALQPHGGSLWTENAGCPVGGDRWTLLRRECRDDPPGRHRPCAPGSRSTA
jgi:methylthioribose-1-phosphate isomerase